MIWLFWSRVFSSLQDGVRDRFNESLSRTRSGERMSEQTLMMRVFKRLKAENRWEEAEPYRNELANAAQAKGFKGIDAQNYTYTELARKFPPVDGKKPEVAEPVKPASKPKAEKQAKDGEEAEDAAQFSTSGGVVVSLSKATSDAEFSVRGLSEIPGNWPDLPPNAPLSAEVSWVQANRLRIVRESSTGVTVDLSKALTPAPSYATLGWLETSIKTYSKFVDVASKATSGQDGEQAEIRREQQSIEEVRRLLASMLDE
jgi:hypothetical protein